MPKRKKINVNITYRIADDEESEKILNIVKEWCVDNFTKWFEKQLEQKQKLGV